VSFGVHRARSAVLVKAGPKGPSGTTCRAPCIATPGLADDNKPPPPCENMTCALLSSPLLSSLLSSPLLSSPVLSSPLLLPPLLSSLLLRSPFHFPSCSVYRACVVRDAVPCTTCRAGRVHCWPQSASTLGSLGGVGRYTVHDASCTARRVVAQPMCG
jgi:hypothetical protein